MLFKGNEENEVRQWIVDLEALLEEMRENEAPRRHIVEQQEALSWLKQLLTAGRNA